jgi:hypothetical protein
MTFALIAAVLTITASAAQVTKPSQSTQSEAQAKRSCKLAGQVSNLLTGAHIRIASLAVKPTMATAPTHTVESDAEGKFSIDNVEPGRYWLSAERQGFVKMDYGARRPSVPGTVLTLEAGKDLTGLMFKLVPQGIIAGRVLYDEGEPLSGVMVQVLQQRYMQRRKRLVPAAAGVQTNDLGEYRVANLSPANTSYLPGKTLNPVLPKTKSFVSPSKAAEWT